MRNPRKNLTEGPVGPVLFRLATPMMWAILSTMLFNVVDTFFIGQLGPIPLAAIGFTFPVIFIITGSAMGIGIGLSSVVSRAVGEGDHHRVAELTTRGLMLAFMVVMVMVGVGVTLHDRLFTLLGAQPEIIILIRQYMIPWFAGIVFLVIPLVGNSAIRATGDSLTPSLVLMLAGGLNAVLDPLFIFGIGPFPRWEIQGAAIATVISYSVTFVAAFYVLIKREKMILFEWPGWSQLFSTWRKILYIGLPAVGTNLLLPLSSGIITRILSSYGPLAVAAYGVGTRIESLAMVGSYALSTAMAAFAGQNIGAGRFDRLREAIRYCLKFSISTSLIVWVILALFSKSIAGLFTDDQKIVMIIQPFLLLVPLSYGCLGFMLQCASCFNAAGRPKYSVIFFTSRLFVFTIPLALLGSRIAGINGVFTAIFIGNLAGGLLAFIFIRRALGNPEKKL